MSLPSPNPVPQRQPKSVDVVSRQVRFWRASAIAALTLAVVLALLNWVMRWGTSAPRLEGNPPNHSAVAPAEQYPMMRWGRLVTERIFIERPDRLLGDPNAFFAKELSWNFGDTRLETVEQLFRNAGLSEASRDWLINRTNWQIKDGMLLIDPPADLLWQLSARSRGQIYNFLAPIPGNRFKTDPFKMTTNLSATWFAGSGVSAQTEHLIRSLTFEAGPMLCFSDPGLLADRTPMAERRLVLKALTRMPAQRAFLRIEQGDDLAILTDYWGAGGQINAMLPLLESLATNAKGSQIDLAYLLPRFCRERLFTFPDHANQPDPKSMDCFWTALNFFRYPPQQRFMDVPSRLRQLQDHYEAQPGEPHFGNLFVFYAANQEPIHVCVYIAGDIVFTKNGPTESSPWVLMSYRDMLDLYSMDGTPTMRVLRPREVPPS